MANQPVNTNYLAYDVITLEREFADLLTAFPELAEDETLRADTIEGETDAHRILSRLTNIALDAKSMATAIKERISDLTARRARHERREEAMRTLIFRLLKAADLQKVNLPEATLSVNKKAVGVEITDETLLPDNVVRLVRQPDKTLIKDLLKAGTEVPGAVLGAAGETLMVRVA